MKKILLWLLIIDSIAQSNELLTSYRNNGIDNIEKTFDSYLAKEQYWSEYIQNKTNPYGYFEDATNILYCNKENPKLKLYANNNYKLIQLDSFDALVGKIKGDKQIEGDLKTPIGAYRLKHKKDTVDSFYGPMAFVTNYPNIYDQVNQKNGHGIWIHGVPADKKRDKATKGCIAIENDSLINLDQKINYKKTILIISEHTIKPVSKKELLILLTSLYKWRYAWKYNQFNNYISFYNDDFIRFDGKRKPEFMEYKQRVFSYNNKKSIIFTNINISIYPDEKNRMFLITFIEKYNSPRMNFVGKKELFVKIKNNSFSILTEK